MAESSNTPKKFFEHAKSVMTLRSGKVLKQTSKTKETNPEPLTKSKPSKSKEDLKKEDELTASKILYLLKTPFLYALKAPIPVEKKGG